jgi:hypothetical protein
MLPGCGDQATWGRCYGHPHDPRTPEYDEEIDMSFDGTRCDLRLAAFRLEKVDTLLDDVVEFLQGLREDAVLDIRYGDKIDAIVKRAINI